MNIEPMTEQLFQSFWPVFKSIIEEQKTYAFDPSMRFDDACRLWCIDSTTAWAAVENETVLGSYFLRPNAQGPGSHICNCGYMVAPEARNKGIAATLCRHSQKTAVKKGFSAMQFNCVVSSNTTAVRLWQSLGFKIVGTVPEGFNHKELGFVDTYIMYKKLIE